jgi:flavin-dependent dehydrogenase
MQTGYDVIVIGAGLAGGAAACLLAEAGVRVLLLERHRYPHDKLCGEFLSPETEASFRRLGVWEELLAAGATRLTTAHLTAPDGFVCDIALPGAAIGFSRWRLDPLLAERAASLGATVRDGCAATEISGSLATGFVVRTQAGEQLNARSVLGAWGKRATLDRHLQRPFFARRQPYLGLKAHFSGLHTSTRVEMHGFPGGYVGMCAVEGGAFNVCLLTTEASFAAAGREPARFWQWIGQQNAAVGAQLAGAEQVSPVLAISQIAFGAKAPLERDIVMLGDSAELISPLAGNGMAIALRSAELAAPHVLAFLTDGDARALTHTYPAAWEREFRPRLRLGRLLQPLFLQPALLSVGLRLVRRFPALGAWLVRGTRGRAEVPGG